MRTYTRGLAAGVCTTTLAMVAAPLLAAEGSDAAPLEEIIVTAQKRTERLQDVPISITVVDQQQLERQQVNSVADLARLAPSLEVQQAPGQSVGGGGQIRGIGTQSFQQGAVGSVGIVVDQVSQGNINISDLFDVSRVEVLKGPQGTLFGLTTSAGVINITTNAPDFEKFSARVRTELSGEGTAGSDYGVQLVQGLVNVPVSDTSALRLSSNMTLRSGVNRNTLDDDLDEHTNYGFRGRFLWEATDNLTINLIGDYNRIDDDDTDFFVVFKANPALAAELAQCGIVASESNRSYCSQSKLVSNNESAGGSAQVDYDFGPAALTSITAYRSQNSGPNLLDIFRLDVNPLKIIQGSTNSDSSLFSQEFRIAAPDNSIIEYTAGVFYSKQKTDNEPVPLNISLTLPFPPFPVMPIVSLLGNDVSIDDESKAIFGQATVHLGERLRLIGGLRYTDEDLRVDYRSLDGVGTVGSTGDSVDNVSWKAGAQFVFDRDFMVFATVSRGYKGSQVALGDLTVPGAQPRVIRPEIPTAYELGLKGSYLQGRLIVDASVFYTDLEDFQGQLCTPNANGGLRCDPQNIDNVISKGAELTVVARPLDSLSLNVGVGYNPVEYPSGFTGQDGSALGGKQLQGAPKWKVTTSGEYTYALGNSLRGFVAADAIYKSDLRLAASTDPNLTYQDDWTLGGRLGLRSETGRWTAAIFARNITNNHEPVVRFANFPDGSIGSYGQLLTPQAFRLVGINVDVNF